VASAEADNDDLRDHREDSSGDAQRLGEEHRIFHTDVDLGEELSSTNLISAICHTLLPLAQLTELAGVSVNYVLAIEVRKRDPGLSTIAALAKGLGVPSSVLVLRERDSRHLNVLEDNKEWKRVGPWENVAPSRS
jgi:hypothetical protein